MKQLLFFFCILSLYFFSLEAMMQGRHKQEEAPPTKVMSPLSLGAVAEVDSKSSMVQNLTVNLLPQQLKVLREKIEALKAENLWVEIKEDEKGLFQAPLNSQTFYRDLTIVVFSIRLTTKIREMAESQKLKKTHKSWKWLEDMKNGSFWMHLFSASHSGTEKVEGFSHVREEECYERYPHLKKERADLEREDTEWQKRFNPYYRVSTLGNVPIGQLMAAQAFMPKGSSNGCT